MHVLAKMEGLSAEPAAAVGFAGLFKLVRTGVIKPGESIVVNCTGHTMPAEESLFGPHWTRDVEFPAEGLGHAGGRASRRARIRLRPTASLEWLSLTTMPTPGG